MNPKIYLLTFLLTMLMLNISAQQLSLKWAQRFGQSSWDYVNCLTTSNSGNYLLGGSLKGLLPSDSTLYGLANSNNAYIALCDTNGNLLWQKIFGGNMFDNITSLTNSTQGIFIGGIFQDTIRFGDKVATSSAYSGGFLTMIDEQGNPFWLKNIGGQARIKNILLSSNSKGDIFVAATFEDSLQLYNQEIASNGEKGIFLATLLSNGDEINPIVIKGTGSCNLGGFSCNDSIICVAGSYSDTLQVSDTMLVSLGEEDFFLAIYSYTGILKHIISAGGIGNEAVNAITISPSGKIGITGIFDNSLLFDNKILQTNGGKDIFVAVLDSTFKLKWISGIGGIGDDHGYTINTTGNDDFLISGNFIHNLQLPDENGNIIEMDASSAFGNAFIAKFNDFGDLKASFNLPATSEDYCKSLIAGNDGSITAAGNFYQTIMIQTNIGDTNILISEGERDIFLLKFMDMCTSVIVNAGSDTSLCPGQSIHLASPQYYPYFRWLPEGLPNQELEIDHSGAFKLLITDQNGCIASDSLNIEMYENSFVFAGNDTTIDAGSNLVLDLASASDLNTNEWTTSGTGSFDNAFQVNSLYSPSFSDISTGTIQLTLSSTNQCGTSDSSLFLTIQQDDDGITAFPNPSQGLVTLVCNQGFIIQSASITTQFGTIIEANIVVNGPFMQYNLSSYPPGSFLFHLKTETNIVTKIIHKL